MDNAHSSGHIYASKRAGLLRWMSHHLRGPWPPSCTWLKFAQLWVTPALSGMAAYVKRTPFILRRSRLPSPVASFKLRCTHPQRQILKALDWPSFRWRCETASLRLLHCFLNRQQEPLTNCLPPFAFSRNRRSQTKPRQLIFPAARTTRHTIAFFVSTSVAWNTLSTHIQNLTNAQQFRKAHQTRSLTQICLRWQNQTCPAAELQHYP